MLERRCNEIEAFDGREDRDGGRNHCVAVEQRRTGHPEQGNDAAAITERTMRQGHEAQRSAFAIVVGLQNHDDILERDDDDQCPDHQRKNAEDHLRGQGSRPSCRRQRFLQGVERARTDVAVDDADRAERQNPKRRTRAAVLALFCWGCCSCCGHDEARCFTGAGKPLRANRHKDAIWTALAGHKESVRAARSRV